MGHHHGVAVDVHGSLFLAQERHLACAYRIDIQVLVDMLGEQAQRQSGGGIHRKLAHDGDVHQPVLEARFRGDIGVVAPLPSVGKRDEECRHRLVNPLTHKVIRLGLVLKEVFDDVLQVGLEPAAAACGELVCHQRVEANPAGAEERTLVHEAVVCRDNLRAVEHFDGAVEAGGYAQVPCKAVPAAVGNDTHGGVCVAYSVGYLVDGAVTAYCHYGVVALLRKLLCELRGMPRILRKHHRRRELLSIQQFFNQFRYAAFRPRPRYGVDDKCYILHSYFLCYVCLHIEPAKLQKKSHRCKASMFLE